MNLSVNATVLKSPGSAYVGPQVVLLTVSAKNNISKSLLIRKSFWVAHALDLHGGMGDSNLSKYSESEVINDVNDRMSPGRAVLSIEGNASSWCQHAKEEWDVIGFGPLFDSNEIRPQEEIKVQRIILVPPRSFDLLRVRVILPSFSRSSSLADDDLIQVVGGIRSPSKDSCKLVSVRRRGRGSHMGSDGFLISSQCTEMALTPRVSSSRDPATAQI
ncbi:MAG: hypothetical protein ACKOYK_08030 [Cyanobium sp.]